MLQRLNSTQLLCSRLARGSRPTSPMTRLIKSILLRAWTKPLRQRAAAVFHPRNSMYLGPKWQTVPRSTNIQQKRQNKRMETIWEIALLATGVIQPKLTKEKKGLPSGLARSKKEAYFHCKFHNKNKLDQTKMSHFNLLIVAYSCSELFLLLNVPLKIESLLLLLSYLPSVLRVLCVTELANKIVPLILSYLAKILPQKSKHFMAIIFIVALSSDFSIVSLSMCLVTIYRPVLLCMGHRWFWMSRYSRFHGGSHRTHYQLASSLCIYFQYFCGLVASRMLYVLIGMDARRSRENYFIRSRQAIGQPNRLFVYVA